MKLTKHTIHGKKGITVCYTLPNFRFDSSDNHIKWDAFRFYTPEGTLTDEKGFSYFDVPADEVPVERDDSLNKDLLVLVSKDDGCEAVEIYEDAESEPVTIGLEGDCVANLFIPADPAQDIIVDYKEVIDG